MSSNLFDTYSPTEYIPRPFDAYMKAGEAQQGQYNQLRDAMQTQQDAFNNMKVRMADEGQKNEFLSNIQQQALDLYEKNKHYNPDMYSEVRSFMRKAARDPRINAWSTALKNEQDFKDIEKRLKAAGQEPLYSNRHAIETPVYDNKGNMIYNPETTDLGIEGKLDWVNAGKKLVSEKILPRLTQSGMKIDYIKQKGGDGKIYERPVIVDSEGKVLSKNEPRVQKALKELMPIWEQESTEGRQWKRFNPEGDSFDFLSRLVAEQNDVKSSFKDVAGSQFNKFMASFGGNETQGFVSSPFLSSAYNPVDLGQEPSIGKDVTSPTRSITQTQYKDLDKQERVKLYNESRAAYNKYRETLPKFEVLDKNERREVKPLAYQDWMESQGSTSSNPYGEILTKYLTGLKKANENSVISTQSYVPEDSFKKYAEARTDALSNSNALILSGKNYSLQPIGNALGGSDISQYHTEYAGHNSVVPTVHGGTQKVAVYKVYVPEDKFEEFGLSSDDASASRTDKRQYVDEDGKKKSAYAVEVGIPVRKLTSWQAARESDLSTYGPDKTIASEQDYAAAHNYGYNKDVLEEYGYKLLPDEATGKYIVINNKGKQIGQVSPQTLGLQGMAERIINDTEKNGQ